jgi:hypothetical protein
VRTLLPSAATEAESVPSVVAPRNLHYETSVRTPASQDGVTSADSVTGGDISLGLSLPGS